MAISYERGTPVHSYLGLWVGAYDLRGGKYDPVMPPPGPSKVAVPAANGQRHLLNNPKVV